MNEQLQARAGRSLRRKISRAFGRSPATLSRRCQVHCDVVAEYNRNYFQCRHSRLLTRAVEQIVDCDNTKDAEHNRADCSVFGGWPYLAFQ
jgi:hypothetical protein